MEDGRLLAIRRSKFVPAPNLWCLPGGSIEPGEEEAVAVVREFHEELGSVVEPVAHLWRSTTAWDVELSWWQVRRMDEAPLMPEPKEVAAFGWYTPDDLARLPDLLGSMHDFLNALRHGIFQVDLSGDAGEKGSGLVS